MISAVSDAWLRPTRERCWAAQDVTPPGAGGLRQGQRAGGAALMLPAGLASAAGGVRS